MQHGGQLRAALPLLWLCLPRDTGERGPDEIFWCIRKVPDFIVTSRQCCSYRVVGVLVSSPPYADGGVPYFLAYCVGAQAEVLGAQWVAASATVASDGSV